jgi:hypothetical protein
MSGRPDQRASGDPHETRRQAAVDVAGTYKQARRLAPRGLVIEANVPLLHRVRDLAEVTLGKFDAQVPGRLAFSEPGSCAAVVGRVTRARATWREAAGAVALLPDPRFRRARHSTCPIRCCRCRECRREQRRYR